MSGCLWFCLGLNFRVEMAGLSGRAGRSFRNCFALNSNLLHTGVALYLNIFFRFVGYLPLSYAISTLSFLPRTDAARSSVKRVTDLLSGSNNRSSPARLVFIRPAIAVFVSLRRFISRSMRGGVRNRKIHAFFGMNSCARLLMSGVRHK